MGFRVKILKHLKNYKSKDSRVLKCIPFGPPIQKLVAFTISNNLEFFCLDSGKLVESKEVHGGDSENGTVEKWTSDSIITTVPNNNQKFLFISLLSPFNVIRTIDWSGEPVNDIRKVNDDSFLCSVALGIKLYHVSLEKDIVIRKIDGGFASSLIPSKLHKNMFYDIYWVSDSNVIQDDEKTFIALISPNSPPSREISKKLWIQYYYRKEEDDTDHYIETPHQLLSTTINKNGIETIFVLGCYFDNIRVFDYPENVDPNIILRPKRNVRLSTSEGLDIFSPSSSPHIPLILGSICFCGSDSGFMRIFGLSEEYELQTSTSQQETFRMKPGESCYDVYGSNKERQVGEFELVSVRDYEVEMLVSVVEGLKLIRISGFPNRIPREWRMGFDVDEKERMTQEDEEERVLFLRELRMDSFFFSEEEKRRIVKKVCFWKNNVQVQMSFLSIFSCQIE